MSDRTNFGRLPDVLPIPDLIEIQTKSFEDFLQKDVPPMQREYKGFQEVLKDTFPLIGARTTQVLSLSAMTWRSPRFHWLTA